MSTASPIGLFERYLSLWVALCIAAGIGLGSAFPALFQSLAGWEYGSVNFIVAVLIFHYCFIDLIVIGSRGHKLN